MRLYQRGRIWYLTFYVRGKRVQESTGTADRRNAEKFYALRMMEVERGDYAQSAKITLTQFWQKYREYARANKRSWLRDQQIMTHLTLTFGKLKLQDIGALGVEQYKIERVRTVSPATVNREIALLKHMYNLADSWGLYFGKNPVKGVKFLSENNEMLRVVSEEEETLLLHHCLPCLQDLVSLAINTGLRLGEILKLKWEEVDLENAAIRTIVKKNRRCLTCH